MTDKVFIVDDVLSELMLQAHEMYKYKAQGIRFVEQNADLELVPCIPDNVLQFPTHKRVQ